MPAVASENFHIISFLPIQIYNHFTASTTSHHCSIFKQDVQQKREETKILTEKICIS